jgi:hypothetical protein
MWQEEKDQRMDLHMNYSWTVVINKFPYGVTCSKPWTAVSRALQKWRKEHPDSSMVLFDILLLNRSIADQKFLYADRFYEKNELQKRIKEIFDELEQETTR